MNFSFEGKRILVTGAGQGIGKALALRLSAYKAKVIGLCKTQDNLDALQAEDPTIETVNVDLTNWEASRRAIESVLPIDLLVNNAAVAILGPFLQVKPEDIDYSFACNVKSLYNVTQVVARNMIERNVGGSIVMLSSQASQASLKDHAVYCATKAAVDGLMRVLALELGPHNIRVNCVNPTVVMTEMGRLGWSEPSKARDMLSKIPLGRFAEVDEVVNVVTFLLSNKSSMINGVTLPIDGGFLST